MFTRQCQLNLQWEHPLRLEAVEVWLSTCFGLAGHVDFSIDEDDASSRVRAWLSQATALQMVVLQAAQVPLLQPALVSEVCPPGEEVPFWRVQFNFHNPHALAEDLLRDTLIRALKLLSWMVDHPVEQSEHRRHLFESLEREWIQPLRNQQMGGGSTLPLLRAAHGLQIPVVSLGNGLFQFGWGCRSVRLHRSASQHDAALGALVTQDKAWTCITLRAGGFPVTEHHVVKSADEALQVARGLGWPVVIKPVDRDRGEGVTTHVDSDLGLVSAFECARMAAGRTLALVEKQVEGYCHRLLVARGRLLYAVERRPVTVEGDGVRTIRDWVADHNERLSWMPPWTVEKPMAFDEAMRAYLGRQGMSLDTIPALGVAVPLRPFDSMAWGGQDVDMTASLHPENRRLAERVATFLGLEVAGVDLISPDIGVPWYQNGARINEVNFAPMLGIWPISGQYLPEFFRRLCPQAGRIPVRLMCGDATVWSRMVADQQRAFSEGNPCHMTRCDHTLEPDGSVLPMISTRLGQRCEALLLNQQVQALWVVMTDPGELDDGIGVDRFDSIGLVVEDPLNRKIWESVLVRHGLAGFG